MFTMFSRKVHFKWYQVIKYAVPNVDSASYDIWVVTHLGNPHFMFKKLPWPCCPLPCLFQVLSQKISVWHYFDQGKDCRWQDLWPEEQEQEQGVRTFASSPCWTRCDDHLLMVRSHMLSPLVSRVVSSVEVQASEMSAAQNAVPSFHLHLIFKFTVGGTKVYTLWLL